LAFTTALGWGRISLFGQKIETERSGLLRAIQVKRGATCTSSEQLACSYLLDSMELITEVFLVRLLENLEPTYCSYASSMGTSPLNLPVFVPSTYFTTIIIIMSV
jgi:hypothetical protein